MGGTISCRIAGEDSPVLKIDADEGAVSGAGYEHALAVRCYERIVWASTNFQSLYRVTILTWPNDRKRPRPAAGDANDAFIGDEWKLWPPGSVPDMLD